MRGAVRRERRPLSPARFRAMTLGSAVLLVFIIWTGAAVLMAAVRGCSVLVRVTMDRRASDEFLESLGRIVHLDTRVHFYAGLRVARLLITVTNPNRAEHKGGFWDLGDPGSVLLRDVSMAFGLPSGPGTGAVHASIDSGDGKWSAFATPFELYQDSSGGEHWQSSNHLNRERRVPTTFRGYRLKSGDQISQGLRATPITAISRGTTGIAVTTPHFWQNFPKALEASGSQLIVRLFPGQFGQISRIPERRGWEKF